MSDNDKRPLLNRPAAHLLDELESIRGSLTEGLDADDVTSADIPLLDDMVIHNLNSNAKLLNIDQIFEDRLAEENPLEATPPIEKIIEPPVQFPRFTLDVDISDDLVSLFPDEPDYSQVAAAPPLSQSPASQSSIAEQPSITQQPVPPQPSRQRVRPDDSRDVLIQELIDEFIPLIEAELHARLQQLDDATLRHLKDPK